MPPSASPATRVTHIAALITWIITAGGGLYLLTIWLIEYDHEFQSAAETRLPVPVISAHALLAIGGLAVWATYLITDTPTLAWAAALDLGVVAVLGLTMAARWIVVYRTHEAPAGTRGAPVPAAARAGAGYAGGSTGYAGGGTSYAGAAAGDVSPRIAVPPERHFPLPVVIGHGIFAAATIILVLLTALKVGGS